MTKKAEPKTDYNLERQYEVRLAKTVAYKGRTLSPRNRHVMLGKMLSELPPEAIADVQPL